MVYAVLNAIRWACMLSMYGGFSAVIYSVCVIKNPNGPTPAVSPAMQCVMNLTIQFFLVYLPALDVWRLQRGDLLGVRDQEPERSYPGGVSGGAVLPDDEHPFRRPPHACASDHGSEGRPAGVGAAGHVPEHVRDHGAGDHGAGASDLHALGPGDGRGWQHQAAGWWHHGVGGGCLPDHAGDCDGDWRSYPRRGGPCPAGRPGVSWPGGTRFSRIAPRGRAGWSFSVSRANTVPGSRVARLR